LLTTRYHGNSAWIDLDSRESRRSWEFRPGCSVNNNLYPANGVLNMPNLTAGVPAITRPSQWPACRPVLSSVAVRNESSSEVKGRDRMRKYLRAQ